ELHAANYYAYGYRRMWKALRRAGEQVPRCQVQRLMRSNEIVGAKRRGKPWRTTKPDPQASRRPDLVQRDFSATSPNRLWVADISSLRCWEGTRLLRLRPRRLLADDRRLAARWPHANRPRPRRVADGSSSTRPGRRRRADPPQRPRQPVHLDRLHAD